MLTLVIDNTSPSMADTLSPLAPELSFVQDGESVTVTFPDMRVARIFHGGQMWRGFFPREERRDVIGSTPKLVLYNLYQAWMRDHAPAPLAMTPAEFASAIATARAARVTEFTKLLRDLLRRRTGRPWSVRMGSGTASSYVHIKAAAGRDMPPMEAALLDVVTNLPSTHQNAIFSPDARVQTVRAIIGTQSA